jgi:hypothetical protein
MTAPNTAAPEPPPMKPPVIIGVGMPASLKLDQFGSIVAEFFGEFPYHVGSSIHGKAWRDVDVRVILDDEKYAAMGFGAPEDTHRNGAWVALVLAFSALGREMTGLPIDFQIQQQSYANLKFPNARCALGMVPWRFARSSEAAP